jgi:hypothetical protein
MSTAPVPSCEIGSAEDTLDSVLTNVYNCFQEEIMIVADTVSVCYSSAMDLFSAISQYKSTLSANLIAIRCNLSCLRRSLASILSDMIVESLKQSANDKLFPMLQVISSPLLVSAKSLRKNSKKTLQSLAPLEFVSQAVEICQDSILDINSSTHLESTGASIILSLELATNYTFAGQIELLSHFNPSQVSYTESVWKIIPLHQFCTHKL